MSTICLKSYFICSRGFLGCVLSTTPPDFVDMGNIYFCSDVDINCSRMDISCYISIRKSQEAILAHDLQHKMGNRGFNEISKQLLIKKSK
jgi:hypothetical protein